MSRKKSHGEAYTRPVARVVRESWRNETPSTLDEARASLARVLNAPLTQLVRTLAEPAAMLARTLKARSEQTASQ